MLKGKHEKRLVSKLRKNKISYAVIPVAGCNVIQLDNDICNVNRLGTVFSGKERMTIDEFVERNKKTTTKKD